MKKNERASIFSAGIVTTAFMAIVLITAVTPAAASDASDAQALVDKARITFQDFMSDQNYSWLQQHLKDAKGVMIYPQVFKAGFILGGSGGSGVLLVRNQKGGGWSQPAFYTMASASFGMQIGAESAEVVMLVMNQKALDSLFTSSIKLGASLSIAAGPYGVGAKSNITTDFIAFTKAEGAYVGLDLSGSDLAVRDSLNRAYYGKSASPLDIIVRQTVHNKGSEDLRQALKMSAK
jgi:lipid-binding SYLF domain-containing protein